MKKIILSLVMILGLCTLGYSQTLDSTYKSDTLYFLTQTLDSSWVQEVDLVFQIKDGQHIMTVTGSGKFSKLTVYESVEHLAPYREGYMTIVRTRDETNKHYSLYIFMDKLYRLEMVGIGNDKALLLIGIKK